MNLHFPEHDKLEERYLDPPKKRGESETEIINYVECRGHESFWNYPMMSTEPGLKQTFAMYCKPYAQTHYASVPIIKLTRIGALVSLESFYDMGRLPLHLGGDFGRVMWTALTGSTWLDFKTWSSFRWEVLDRDGGICQICHKVITTKDQSGYWRNVTFVCDHIIPLCKGGRDWWQDQNMTNFQTLCEDCNKIKTAHDMAKPKLIKQKLDLRVIQYLGFVFEERQPVNQQLDKFVLVNSSVENNKEVKA